MTWPFPTTSVDISNDTGDQQADLLLAQTRQLLVQATSAFIAAPLTAVAMVALLWNTASRHHLLLWLSSLVVVYVVRGAHLVMGRRIAHNRKAMEKWLRSYVFGTVVAGLTWGSLAGLFFPTGSLLHDFLIIISIGGVSCGALASNCPVKEAYPGFVIPAIMVPAGVFLYQGTYPYMVMGGLLCLLTAVFVQTGNHMYRVNLESLKLRFENQGLISYLDAEREKRGNLNSELLAEIEERKQAEQALLEKENNFRAFFESMGDMVVVADLTGRIITANPALTHRLGYTVDEVRQMHVLDLRPGDRRKEAEASLMAIIRRERNTCPLPFQAKDGTLVPVETRVWFGSWNGANCVFGVSKDLSAEQELLQKFERLFRFNPNLIALCTLPGRKLVDVNDTFLTTLGYSRSQVIGRSGTELGIIARTDIKAMDEHFRAKGKISNWEVDLKCADGSKRYGLLSAEPITNQGQKHLLTVVIDITERKRAEDELRKLSQMVEQSPVIVFITDLEGRIEYVNPKFTEVTGYTFEEVRGKTPRILKSGLTPPERYQEMWRVISQGKSWRGEFRNRCKDGRIYWESALISPVHDGQGKVTHYLAIKEDITERKRAEEALVQANHRLQAAMKRAEEMARRAEKASRAKSLFLANMSHEIRTPLNAILGFSQVLESDENLSADQHQIVKTINRSGEHLLALINDILEMSRISAGRAVVKPVSFNLYDLFNGVEEMFRLRAQRKGIDFMVECDRSVPRWVIADAGKLRQILINLLGNAIKFTDKGHVLVSVRTTRVDEEPDAMRLIVEVEDSGPGIAAAEMAELFQPFSQAEAGLKSGGTGLGLAISREFCQMMGGDISVSSRAGEGSCFRFEVRVRPTEAVAEAEAAGRKKIIGIDPACGPVRALVMDDNRENSQFLSTVLRSTGFQVKAADNAAQGREIFRQWRPQLVLVDLRVARMNDFETIRRIKQEATGHRVSVIALTAGNSGNGHRPGPETGVDAYLSKPFRIFELLDLVGKVLGLRYRYDHGRPKGGGGDARPVSSEDILSLPPELVTTMKHAVDEGDMARLSEAIEQVAGISDVVAHNLRQLAENYDYEALDALLAGGDEK